MPTTLESVVTKYLRSGIQAGPDNVVQVQLDRAANALLDDTNFAAFAVVVATLLRRLLQADARAAGAAT